MTSAHFNYGYAESSVLQERPEIHFRKHSAHHGPTELTLHGGTADLAFASTPGDALRIRLGSRNMPTLPHDRSSILPPFPSFPRTDTMPHAREEEKPEPSEPYHYATRTRPRRGTDASRGGSRSPSPGPPPISGTLAVIKAQAFGALRRTRTRTKRTSDGAAKAAVEALEARGIGMGIANGPPPAKRPRLQHESNDESQA